MTYKQFLASSILAKITLLLLVLDIIAGGYIVTQIFRYIGAVQGVIGAVLLIVIAALVWICHRKKTKAALVIEIVLTVVLAFGVAATAKISSFAGNITNVGEYETVQIVALKDSDITAEDDFSSYTLGYDNDDSGAYERSGEILEEHDKTVSKSKPYGTTDELYKDFTDGDTELMVLTGNTKSDLSVIDEEYDTKIKVIFEKKYTLDEVKAKEVDIN